MCLDEGTDGEGIEKLTSDPLREEHAEVTGEERVEVEDGVEIGE